MREPHADRRAFLFRCLRCLRDCSKCWCRRRAGVPASSSAATFFAIHSKTWWRTLSLQALTLQGAFGDAGGVLCSTVESPLAQCPSLGLLC